MNFTIVIDPRAIQDIQEAIDYYDEKQPGLGRRFQAELDEYLSSLEKNPFFNKRYDEVHCLPLKRFPYMVHFTIDDKNLQISVYAVFHTALDTDKWQERKNM
jgi:toxin ParE1/3/4